MFRANEMGILAFDTSAAGLGGYSYAPGAKGNVATEDVVYTLEKSGINTGVDLEKLITTGLWISTQPGIPYGSRAGAALASKRPKVPIEEKTKSSIPASTIRSWELVEDTGEYRVSRAGADLKITHSRPKMGNAITDSMLEGLTNLLQRHSEELFHLPHRARV